jgi:hypothetical protein
MPALVFARRLTIGDRAMSARAVAQRIHVGRRPPVRLARPPHIHPPRPRRERPQRPDSRDQSHVCPRDPVNRAIPFSRYGLGAAGSAKISAIVPSVRILTAKEPRVLNGPSFMSRASSWEKPAGLQDCAHAVERDLHPAQAAIGLLGAGGSAR